MVVLNILPKTRRIFVAACGCFIAVVGVVAWLTSPYLIAKLIDLNVILYENSDQFERWENLPQPMEFKVYIFNVTNSAEIIKGSLPIVKEVGPYVYKQYRTKNVEKISKDKKDITYTSKQIYKFDRIMSYPLKETDQFVVLNVPMNVILHIKDKEISRVVRRLLKILNNKAGQVPIMGDIKRLFETIAGSRRKAVLQLSEDILNSQLGFINEYILRLFPNETSLFMKTTPKQYFFDGITFCLKSDSVIQFICKVVEDVAERRNIKAIERLADGSLKFAFFYFKNKSHDGQYKVMSGINDPKFTAQIITWEGKSQLSLWNNDSNSVSSCNLFEKATDGLLFPPHIKPEGSVMSFSTDICRSVQLFYKETITYRNIIGYRFETGDNFLKKIGSKHSTKCFCITTLEQIPKYKDGCLYQGVMDLSTCQGVPIILSMPHLFDAAPEYQTVKGLHPDFERGKSYVDIEPNTGYPLRGYKRAQFNMFVRKVDQVTFTSNLKTFLMPLIWIEEGTQLNNKMVKLLNDKLFTPLRIANILIYTAVGSGTIIFFVCLLRLLKYRSKRQQNRQAFEDKITQVRSVQ